MNWFTVYNLYLIPTECYNDQEFVKTAMNRFTVYSLYLIPTDGHNDQESQRL